MNYKNRLIILFMCLSAICSAQFNKQWLVSGGGQVSYYEQITTIKFSDGNISSYKGYQTNIGLSNELGYFIAKNLSLSYQFTYLFYDDNRVNGINSYKFYRSGISLSKYIAISNDLFLNFGATPFYTKRIYKEPNTPLTQVEEALHGCIFDGGVSFLIKKNSILSLNLYKQLDNLPEDAFYNNKSGVFLKFMYIFQKKSN